MPTIPRIRFATARVATRIALVVATSLSVAAPAVGAQNLPSKLSDADFWKLVTDFSEANGYFRSDNFLSNERAFQQVLPTLTSTVAPGGVYLGVGPEQNFTYIVALKPKLAFICDIRHQNADHHLLYKALIELSSD